MNPVFIHSSHGDFAVDARSGNVLSFARFDDGDDLSNIARFDVDEWRAVYAGDEPSGQHLDILDFGYWNKAGVYERPARDWRIERMIDGLRDFVASIDVEQIQDPEAAKRARYAQQGAQYLRTALRSDKLTLAIDALRLAIEAMNHAPSFGTGIQNPEKPRRTLTSYELLPRLEKTLRAIES